MADLTTVAAVKRYLSGANASSNQDDLIGALITRESGLIEEWCGRKFSITTQSAKRVNGTGTSVLTVPDAPVISVSSVKDGNTVIPASSDGVAFGWITDEDRIYLMQGKFCYGKKNVVLAYTAGYQESETGIIPAATGNAPPTLTPSTGGTAIEAVSVVDANTGGAFAEVSSAPTSGEFSFANGTFTFAVADANLSVTMTYGFVPPAVEQACIEMVGIDIRNRDNLGINSKSLGGESITYSNNGMNQSVIQQLTPYRRRLIA